MVPSNAYYLLPLAFVDGVVILGSTGRIYDTYLGVVVEIIPILSKRYKNPLDRSLIARRRGKKGTKYKKKMSKRVRILSYHTEPADR